MYFLDHKAPLVLKQSLIKMTKDNKKTTSIYRTQINAVFQDLKTPANNNADTLLTNHRVLTVCRGKLS